MTTGITFAKIVVAFVVVGVVLGAPPAMEMMRRYDVLPAATPRVTSTTVPAVHAAERTLPRVRAPLKPRGRGNARGHVRKRATESYDAYQVPAGTVLPALLRAPLESAKARVEDRVKAILRSSLAQNRLELVPAASIIHGKVLDVVPASRWQPRGRIVVGFYFIEHAATGSRTAIATRPVIFEPIDAIGSSYARRSVDVRVNAGELVHITLAEPLLIRLPR